MTLGVVTEALALAGTALGLFAAWYMRRNKHADDTVLTTKKSDEQAAADINADQGTTGPALRTSADLDGLLGDLDRLPGAGAGAPSGVRHGPPQAR